MLASIFAIIAALLSLEFVAVLALDTFILTFLVVLGVFPDRYKYALCIVGYHDLGYHINLSRQEIRVKQMRRKEQSNPNIINGGSPLLYFALLGKAMLHKHLR